METKNTTPAYETMNVWSKLLLARKLFQETNVKKSGINRHLEFKYFELQDIVPVATKIGYEIGLLFVTTFEPETAQMTVVNVHNPDEIIIFRSPMKEIESIDNCFADIDYRVYMSIEEGVIPQQSKKLAPLYAD